MTVLLPHFARTGESPELPSRAPAIRVIVTGRRAADLVARGTWRVGEDERRELRGGTLRQQVWLVAVDRPSRLAWTGRPGGEAVVLADDEPPEGPAEGWFHCRLDEVLGLPERFAGTLDVVAVLGMMRSEVASVEVRPR